MMKKLMTMVSVIMMTLTATAENKDLTPIESVSVNVPARVRLVYGEEYKLNITAADSLVAQAIRWSVKDGVLKIRSLGEAEDITDVCITIVCPKEPVLTVGRNVEIRESIN